VAHFDAVVDQGVHRDQMKLHTWPGRTICQVSSQPLTERASAQDSCPGALQVHQAADGGLARVRVPAGVLTAGQWQALIAASAELGGGNLDLTSRGNVQLRGLRPDAETALATRLASADLLPSLTHERVRNLLASPLTGRDRVGLADIRPLIGELDRALCERPVLAELSGRFLFALDDGRGDVAGLGADITLIATGAHTATLSLAGIPVRSVSLSDAVTTMLASAEAFLRLRAVEGSNAWRVAELDDGPARIATALVGSGPGAGVGPEAPAPGVPADPSAAPCPIGLISQRDGSTALVVGIPLGRLLPGQAASLSGHDLVLTPWRSIVVPDLSGAEAAMLSASAGAVGLIVDRSSPWLGVTACTGRPGCAKALADVHADATLVHGTGSAGVRETGAGPAVHWVGCERRCGTPAGNVLTIVATASGYRLDGATGTVESASASTWSTHTASTILDELQAIR